MREINVAPLPGQALVALDPQLRLAIDVFPCEDGHAQERSLRSQVLPTVEPRDLWIADRNFCTIAFTKPARMSVSSGIASPRSSSLSSRASNSWR